MSKSNQVISVLISHHLIEPGAMLSLQSLKLQGLMLKKKQQEMAFYVAFNHLFKKKHNDCTYRVSRLRRPSKHFSPRVWIRLL